MIIYLHGFNSSGQSEKAKELSRLLPDIPVIAPDIPTDLTQAVTCLEQVISQCEQQHIMLIGSSLGGYFAQFLARQFDYPVVLINPALQPVTLLMQRLGEQTNYYSGETYTLSQTAVQSLARYAVDPHKHQHPTLLLLDAADELLDSAATAQLYAASAQIKLFEGGSHRFDHLAEAVPLIRDFYHTSILA